MHIQKKLRRAFKLLFLTLIIVITSLFLVLNASALEPTETDIMYYQGTQGYSIHNLTNRLQISINASASGGSYFIATPTLSNSVLQYPFSDYVQNYWLTGNYIALKDIHSAPLFQNIVEINATVPKESWFSNWSGNSNDHVYQIRFNDIITIPKGYQFEIWIAPQYAGSGTFATVNSSSASVKLDRVTAVYDATRHGSDPINSSPLKFNFEYASPQEVYYGGGVSIWNDWIRLYSDPAPEDTSIDCIGFTLTNSSGLSLTNQQITSFNISLRASSILLYKLPLVDARPDGGWIVPVPDPPDVEIPELDNAEKDALEDFNGAINDWGILTENANMLAARAYTMSIFSSILNMQSVSFLTTFVIAITAIRCIIGR